jgi:hypothetical protein
MLDKQQAIQKIKKIQSGWFDRTYPESMKGSLAKRFWDDNTFGFGMEYGYILACLQIFDIEPEEIYNEEENTN